MGVVHTAGKNIVGVNRRHPCQQLHLAGDFSSHTRRMGAGQTHVTDLFTGGRAAIDDFLPHHIHGLVKPSTGRFKFGSGLGIFVLGYRPVGYLIAACN